MNIYVLKIKSIIAIAFLMQLLLLKLDSFSQQYILHPYSRYENINVFAGGTDTLAFPFAGGLNNCQFNSLDVNLDGHRDLLVFDRHGNRLIPFCSNPLKNGSYSFCPEHVAKLPLINQWIITRDYNNDGKDDIFTYTTGGIKVFRNISDTELAFSQITFPYLLSQQGNTLTNILVTGVDYPAIADLDNDGDMDILTFWGLGSFVEWHKNNSMELYGHSDSLVFIRVTTCWGEFAEGNETNVITLDTCVGVKTTLKNSLDGDPKHTGSTLLLNDMNNDGLPDLTLGDVDYSTLLQLTNGGSISEAKISSYTYDFPNSSHPVDVKSFPAAMLVDINNDSVKDLLVSPFEPSLTKSENKNSVWLYINEGSNSDPLYTFQKDNFLQDEMIDFGSGAYPTVFDYNSDGLLDILVGNYGYYDSSSFSITYGLQSFFHSSIALLLNIGSVQSPEFSLVETNIGSLDTLGMLSLTPALADMDGDSDLDLVCGNSKGTFIYCENISAQGSAAQFVLRDKEWFGIDIGDFSAPSLFDMDNDGLIDLISGNKNGTLSFFKNIGSKLVPNFTTPIERFGNVDVTNSQLTNFGYSIPVFATERNGSTILMVGSEYGDIFVFDDIDGNLQNDFLLKGKLPVPYEGIRVGVAIGDFNNDTLSELIIGNYSGGVAIYKGIEGKIFGKPEPNQINEAFLKISPNPVRDILTIDIINRKIANDNQLQIRSFEGKTLATYSNVDFPLHLNFSHYDTGFYIITFTDKKTSCSAKVIKVL